MCFRCRAACHTWLNLFFLNLSQCCFSSLVPQAQYCTGTHVFCPCLDQGRDLKISKPRWTDRPFSLDTAPVKQVVPAIQTLCMLKRTLNNSVKWKLHCSIQIMLWLPSTLSFLIPNHLPHFDRDLNQLHYKRGCTSSWTWISYFPWITNIIVSYRWLNNSTVFPLFLGLQFFHWGSLFYPPISKGSHASFLFVLLSRNRDL